MSREPCVHQSEPWALQGLMMAQFTEGSAASWPHLLQKSVSCVTCFRMGWV